MKEKVLCKYFYQPPGYEPGALCSLSYFANAKEVTSIIATFKVNDGERSSECFFYFSSKPAEVHPTFAK